MTTLEETVKQQRQDIRELQNLVERLAQKLRRYRMLSIACEQLDAAYGKNSVDGHRAVEQIRAELRTLKAGD